jgi:hypothetical protein
MKSTKKNLTPQSWALLGDPISEDQLKEAIKKAEIGKFYTIEESKKLIKEWREQRHSK